MAGHALKLAGIAILAVVLCIVGILVFSGVWARVGLVTASLAIFAVLFAVGWVQDRRR
jgi:hypothetical protein